MKIMITMILSASFIAASSGTTAEEGLMKAIGKVDKTPKPLILVDVLKRSAPTKHIRELHGDIKQAPVLRSVLLKRAARLAKFKAKLRKQKNEKRLGLPGSKVTSAY